MSSQPEELREACSMREAIPIENRKGGSVLLRALILIRNSSARLAKHESFLTNFAAFIAIVVQIVQLFVSITICYSLLFSTSSYLGTILA
jgi:hypothetical protein